MILSLRNIVKTYPNAGEPVRLFGGLSLDVLPGEVVVLLGPSGCGKTTLLKIVAGFETPDEGAVMFDDLSLFHCPPRERQRFRRDHIGFSDQRDRLLPQLTALENVLIPSLGRKSSYVENGRALLAELGLENRLHSFPHMLSGGERQRVSLARAMLLNPQFLLLDEPTASLDPSRTEALLDTIRTLNRERRTSVLIATHDPRVQAGFRHTLPLAAVDTGGAT